MKQETEKRIGELEVKFLRVLSVFLLMTVLIVSGAPSMVLASENDAKTWPACPEIEAQAAAVIDVDTGTILVGKNRNVRRYPASITKIMTALVAIEKTKSFKETVRFTERAVKMEDPESKTLWMKEGEKISMEDALYGLMLESANDIANAIAIHVAGSIEGFAAMMNAKAREVGCTGTNFANPHGLFNENHYVTAEDMAKIAREAAKRPEFRKIAGTFRYAIGKTNKFAYKRFLENDSKMLNPKGYYHYPYCYAAKNGFIDEAKLTFVAFAKKGNMNLAAVTLGAKDWESEYRGTEKLLEYCFKNFKKVKTDGIEIKPEKKEGDLYSKILKKDANPKFYTLKKKSLILPKRQSKKNITMRVEYQKKEMIRFGINKIGTVTYLCEGRPIGTYDLYYNSGSEYALK